MILPDVNTLLYAINSSSDQHVAALKALRRGSDDPRGVALAWTALLAFLRLSTRRGVFPSRWRWKMPCVSLSTASNILGRRWYTPGAPRTDTWAIAQVRRHRRQSDNGRASCRAGDRTRCYCLSFDRDFARFEGLQWTVPVVD
jgi:uncharacterized protein